MAIFDVSLYEPIYPAWTADSTVITADSIYYTADGSPLVGTVESTDAVVNANFISADIFEPVGRVWSADSTAVTADSIYYTADGSPLEGARDATDAEVISISVPIGGAVYAPRRRPLPVVGY